MKKDYQTMLTWGLMAAIIVVAVPELSLAATETSGELSGSVGKVKTGISGIPALVSGLAYIIGAVLMLTGALSLKKHSENPATEPMGKGVGRIVAGGAVISLPAFASYVQSSAGFGDSATVGYQKFQTMSAGS